MVQTRRELAREAMFDDIVRTSRAMLAEGAELSLRAVAGRMGITPPALYRYVASYQELVDLVAFEIDKAATRLFAEAADTRPADDAAGRLICASVAFRQWALANPREFTLVFANPIADTSCVRRDLLTASGSGLLFTDLLHDLWVQTGYPIPSVDELPAAVAEALREPLIPANVEPDPRRGPRPGLGLHAGLDDAVRRRDARGLRPHGPPRHRERRDVHRHRPLVRRAPRPRPRLGASGVADPRAVGDVSRLTW